MSRRVVIADGLRGKQDTDDPGRPVPASPPLPFADRLRLGGDGGVEAPADQAGFDHAADVVLRGVCGGVRMPRPTRCCERGAANRAGWYSGRPNAATDVWAGRVTVMTPFLAESPLRTARRYAERDLKRVAKPADLVWLYDHPLLWLRALQRLDRDVQTHMAKDRAGIAHLKPTAGTSAGPEYLAARVEVETRSLARLHYIAQVRNRIEEVKAILGPEPAIGYMSAGDLIGLMTELAEMADEGDLAATADKAMFWAKRWAKQARETGR